MSNTNYISCIVKILEDPKEKLIDDVISVTEFRVQLPQVGKNTIVDLIFWGILGKDLKNKYNPNDYIIIEGFLSFQDKKNFNLKTQNPERVEITVSKIYPFLLSHTNSISKAEE